MPAEKTPSGGAAQRASLHADELEFRIGENANIELLGSGERMWGEVVGFKRGRFIALWLPALRVEKQRRAFFSESLVAVRTLSGACHLCGFKTTVSSAQNDPYPLLLLNYPERYERVNLRKSERVESFLESKLYYESLETSGIIVDISMGGAKLAIGAGKDLNEANLFVDSEVMVLFKLADDDTEYCATSTIRSVVNKGGRYFVGVQFVSLVGDTENALEKYVAETKG